MKDIFIKLIALEKTQELINDTEKYIYGPNEGIKNTNEKYGIDILEMRNKLINSILQNFENNREKIEELKSSFQKESSENFLEAIMKSKVHLEKISKLQSHRNFLILYIQGVYDKTPDFN